MTLALMVIVSAALLILFGWHLHRWAMHARTPEQIKLGGRICELCECILPLNTLRTHDGHYLCTTCKSEAA